MVGGVARRINGKAPAPGPPTALLASLTLIAVGALIAGLVAQSAVFWAAAGYVFVAASTTLVGYVARALGVVPEVRQLLRLWRRGK
jgi:hypothetical protein